MNYTKTLIKEITVEGQVQRHYAVDSEAFGKFVIVVGEGFDADAAIADSLSSTTPAYVETYAMKRKLAYPSIEDQLDLLYHGGYDAWKAAIDVVKATYPKEQS